MITEKTFLATVVVIVVCVSLQQSSAGQLIQTLEDDIGAENFTYYRLQRPGNIKLELSSLKGDVDIYVSSVLSQPDYSTYELKSETCGQDVIWISSSMARPVYIGLFGHPNNLESKYKLSIYEVEDFDLNDYEQLVDKYERYFYEELEEASSYKLSENEATTRSTLRKSPKADQRGEEEEPLWWSLLIDALKFILEVIL